MPWPLVDRGTGRLPEALGPWIEDLSALGGEECEATRQAVGEHFADRYSKTELEALTVQAEQATARFTERNERWRSGLKPPPGEELLLAHHRRMELELVWDLQLEFPWLKTVRGDPYARRARNAVNGTDGWKPRECDLPRVEEAPVGDTLPQPFQTHRQVYGRSEDGVDTCVMVINPSWRRCRVDFADWSEDLRCPAESMQVWELLQAIDQDPVHVEAWWMGNPLRLTGRVQTLESDSDLVLAPDLPVHLAYGRTLREGQEVTLEGVLRGTIQQPQLREAR